MSFKHTRLLSGILVLSSLFYAGCDLNGALGAFENLDVIIELEPIETYAVGQVLDVSTGRLVTQPVQLTFTAETADAVIDIYSDPMNVQTTSSGFAAFGLRNALSPNPDSPLPVQVRASASGYEPTSTTVVFSAEGEHSFVVYMMRRGAVPQGAAATQHDAGDTDQDGATTQAVTVTTQPEARSRGTASITVPSGTVMQDAAGRPLAGNLQARVVYFNNQDPAALRAFPGGFTSVPVQTPSGTKKAALLTAGFASYEIAAGGQPVSRFGKAVRKTLEIPASTINPKTGQVYKAGDAVGIYNYDPNTGAWVFKTQATLRAAAGKNSGTLSAEYESRGLSYDAAAQTTNVCSAGATINIERNGHTGELKAYLTGADGQGSITPYTIPAGQNSVQLKNAPEGTSGEFVVELSDGQTASVTVPNVCSGTVNLSLPAAQEQQITVTFNVPFSCTLKTTEVPTGTLAYQRLDAQGQPVGAIYNAGAPKTWKRDTKGRLTGAVIDIHGLVAGQTYEFTLTIGQGTATETLTVTGPSMSYTASVPSPSDNCATN